jgi:ATP-binding cassette subfamily C protein
VWRPLRGEIRLDGAALGQWPPSDLGRYIGYLPQDIELFEGTIADNIARFEPNADPNAIVAAAQAAGVHEMVLHLEHGYDTRIGEGGHALSAGQRQRVGLARALYGNPFLVVLDEPNSNLDAEGEAALTAALVSVKSRGGIVIVIAHRAGAISAVDWLYVLNNGQMQHYGRKDEVLREVMKKPPQSPAVARPDASAGRLQTQAGAGV